MTDQHTDMSQTQVDDFLQESRFAVIGTIRKQGAPQLTPVWYLYENGQMYVSMSTSSAKFRNLSRDSRVCICIVAQHPDARAVIVHGRVEFIPGESAEFDDIHWRITRRYYDSDDQARAYLGSIPTDVQSCLVSIAPDKIIAEDWN